MKLTIIAIILCVSLGFSTQRDTQYNRNDYIVCLSGC